jgi:hypothetical protein
MSGEGSLSATVAEISCAAFVECGPGVGIASPAAFPPVCALGSGSAWV